MSGTGRLRTLSALDVAPGRRFAHPDHIAADRATIAMLVADFSRNLDQADERPYTCYLPEETDWYRRVMIPNPGAARRRSRFAVVGFFGRRRIEIDPDVDRLITRISRELDEVIPTVPGLLGYTTHQLVDEMNYANLVMLADASVVETWRRMPPHSLAAEVASPSFYDHVRIYNGSAHFTRCGSADFELRLTQVKYWDFRDVPPWYAIRAIE